MSETRFETKALHSIAKSNSANNLNLSFSSENFKMNSDVLTDNENPVKNPSYNLDLLHILCQLENMENGILFSSGELAIYQTILGLTKFGDHILISKTCGFSINKVISILSAKMGISYSYLDLAKSQKWDSLVKSNTKLILVETLSLPSLEIPDLILLKKFSDAHSLILIADNSFCTSFIQAPVQQGADCVLYSNLYYLEGQSNLQSGIILGTDKYIQRIRKNLIESVPCLSPLNTWIMIRGLETLAVRMERHSFNAIRVGEYLEKKHGVEKVKYPFLTSHPNSEIAKKQMKYGGGLISFSMEGGVVRAKRFIDALKKISFTHKFSIRTTVDHPASTSHLSLSDNIRIQMGAKSNILTLSIGLEHVDDIIEEIDAAISDSKITFKLYKNCKTSY